MSEYTLFNHVKYIIFTCGNLLSKNNRTWEIIFKEKGLFETSENKIPLKITSYTVIEGQLNFTI